MTPSRIIIPLIASLIVAGCASQAGTTTDSSTVSTPTSQPSAATTPPTAATPPRQEETTPPATTPAEAPAQTKTEKGKKRNIPERAFQLDDLAKVTLEINGHKFKCWVMDTDEKIAEGMMHLDESDVADDECMIFVFDPPRQLGFWMRNCHYDIDVAFVGANKKILNTPRMKAYDETSVPSKGTAKYAIEFRAGMFKKWGIQPGQLVKIPDTVKAMK